MKPIRMLTSRYENGDWWAIELQENGVFFYQESTSDSFAQFPVSLEFVKDKFMELGRDFDPAKLPTHAKRTCPYTNK